MVLNEGEDGWGDGHVVGLGLGVGAVFAMGITLGCRWMDLAYYPFPTLSIFSTFGGLVYFPPQTLGNSHTFLSRYANFLKYHYSIY